MNFFVNFSYKPQFVGNNGREPLLDGFIQSVRSYDYSSCKAKSVAYQTVKNHLYEKMKKHDVGIWVKKPLEVEQFTI